jgi:hypothetical protein
MSGYLRNSFFIHGNSPRARPPTARYAKKAAIDARAMRGGFIGYPLEAKMAAEIIS